MSTSHQDRGGLAAPISATIFEGVAARVHGPGDPLRYPEGDEYRRLDQVQKIVQLLPGKDVRREHSDKKIGTVLSARLDGQLAIAKMLITDPTALDEIKRGIVELSLGYTIAKLDGRHQVIDAVQEVSLVDRGRCGSSCSLNAKADAVRDTSSISQEQIARAAMITRISNAWRPANAPVTAITKTDCTGKVPMDDHREHRAELLRALRHLDPGARLDSASTVAIATAVLHALGEADVLAQPRNDFFVIHLAKLRTESPHHAHRFPGGAK